LDDSVNFTSVPTIWDRLSAAGVSGKYYYSNVPFLALWGAKYLGTSHLYEEFLLAAAAGTLPAVSFIDPRYTVLDDGTGNDDHPHADIREGDLFLYRTFEAVARAQVGEHRVHRKFRRVGRVFEHVAPPRATAANNVDTDLVTASAARIARANRCCIAIQPRNTSDPRVSALVFDHTSVLKLIEWRWGLAPLTPRDASNDVLNLAYALKFSEPNAAVPNLPKPQVPLLAAPCLSNLGGGILSSGSTSSPTASLQKLAARLQRSGSV